MDVSEQAKNSFRLFMLTLAIWREARGEPWLGKLAVGQTVENRVKDKRWPDNYRDVILQPWQFSAFNKNDPNAIKFPEEDETAFHECYKAAVMIVFDDYDYAEGANHYCTKSVSPNWAKGQIPVLEIGSHRFYKL